MDISGHALECFSSYLSLPSFSEATSKARFSSIRPAYSVPQSPDLSFFLLHLLPLHHILITFKDISYHFYTDDILLFNSFKA